MNRAEFVFAAIDVLFHPTQNYIKKEGVKCIKDISYNDQYPECKGDIYFKEGAPEPMPVIINVHGGGFVKGDKKHRKSIAHLYADRGWFVWNINYRLSPKYAFPALPCDVVCALNFLKEIKNQYNLNLDKVVLTGDSAGAYAATYATAVAFNDELADKLEIPRAEIKPAGLVSFCGIYDLVSSLKLKIPFGMVRCIGEGYLHFKFNKDFSNKEEYKFFNEVSPSGYVNEKWCPTILAISKKDMFCKGQGEILYDNLLKAGVPVREKHSTKFIDNHCYHFNFWTKTSKDTMNAVYEFLDELYAK
ncbi:MAG: alpha/beta hydrolase [Clostridia bacterium]|nr:alpha/beta hydrolase [Clostridia bacterium]